jgi:hypothetical protein
MHFINACVVLTSYNVRPSLGFTHRFISRPACMFLLVVGLSYGSVLFTRSTVSVFRVPSWGYDEVVVEFGSTVSDYYFPTVFYLVIRPLRSVRRLIASCIWPVVSYIREYCLFASAGWVSRWFVFFYRTFGNAAFMILHVVLCYLRERRYARYSCTHCLRECCYYGRVACIL